MPGMCRQRVAYSSAPGSCTPGKVTSHLPFSSSASGMCVYDCSKCLCIQETTENRVWQFCAIRIVVMHTVPVCSNDEWIPGALSVRNRKVAVLSWSSSPDVARLYWSVDGETPHDSSLHPGASSLTTMSAPTSLPMTRDRQA